MLISTKVDLRIRFLLAFVCVCQIFGSRVRVDSTAKVAEIELAEKEKMKEKVDRILKHGINCFINRYKHKHTNTHPFKLVNSNGIN